MDLLWGEQEIINCSQSDPQLGEVLIEQKLVLNRNHVEMVSSELEVQRDMRVPVNNVK